MENSGVKKFQDALKNKNRSLHVLAKNGQKIMGYFCTYTPVEVIHAAGFVPVRLMGDSGTLSGVDAHVPGFTCPYLRRAFESGIRGLYDAYAGIVQGYTCDAACGLINIWKENIDGKLFHTVPLPYNDTKDAREYLRCALDELNKKLCSIGGRRIDATIENSVNLYASIREFMTLLYEERYSGTLPLSAGEFFTIVQAGFVVPPEIYLDMLHGLRQTLQNTDPCAAEGIPVVVSGSIIEEPQYADLIEASGGRIVGDDLCTGLRHFHQPDIRERDPIDKLMERHFRRMPCPARSRAIHRAQVLKDLVRKAQAKGVLFLFQKFCTPHLADYPVIKDMLHQEEIPSVMVEMDETGGLKGQIQTRLEGFFETMG